MRTVPKGWSEVPLTTVVKSKSGNSKIIKGKNSSTPQVGLYQGYSATGPDVWVKEANFRGPGIVVSAVGARCGKTFLALGEWTAIANTHVLLPQDGIDQKFLWYVSNREDWWVKSGTAQPFVKVKDTLERPFRLPPLAEQQRIVEILEEQFSCLDAALASIRTVREKVAIFPLSVIAGLIGAKTTDAKTQRLFDTFVLQRGFDLPKHSRLKGDVPVVTSSGITTTHSMAKVQAPGVVTGRSGTIGFVQYVETDFWPLNTTLYVKDFKGNNPRFVYYLLQTVQLKRFAGGSTVPSLDRNTLSDISLRIPEIAIQQKIVEMLDSVIPSLDFVYPILEQLEARIASSRRSLLHAAFSGTLTARWRETHHG